LWDLGVRKEALNPDTSLRHSIFIHAKAWFDIYPPPEDSLFYNFFFNLTGRFSDQKAALKPET
jgi:hypothetical protein